VGQFLFYDGDIPITGPITPLSGAFAEYAVELCFGGGGFTTYDVYFDTVNPPATLIHSGLTDPSCEPVPYPLDGGTTFYWQVVATHPGRCQGDGPVWSWTTAGGGGCSPPTNPEPANEATDVPIDTLLQWDNSGDPGHWQLVGTLGQGGVSSTAGLHSDRSSLPDRATYLKMKEKALATLEAVERENKLASVDNPSAASTPVAGNFSPRIFEETVEPKNQYSKLTTTPEDEWLVAHPGEVFPLAIAGETGGPRIAASPDSELIGVDFDNGAGSPTNWTTTLGGSAPIPLLNLKKESGASTIVDIELASTGGTFSNFATTPNASTIPIHTNVLTGLSDYFYESGDPLWTFTFNDLVPGDTYNVYVFGLRGFEMHNAVTISGGSPSIHFAQDSTTPGNLWINGELGNNARTLQSFAELMTADGSGEITITVAGPVNSATIAGLAIEPTVNPVAVTYDVYFDTVNPPVTLIHSGLTDPSCEPVPYPLASRTTYYWQVVENNSGGCQADGPVWSFTTAEGCTPPPVPINPEPTIGAAGVPIDTILRWNGRSTLQNGGFETGDFTDWTTVTGPGYAQLQPWTLATAGSGAWFSNGVPFEGTCFAQNGFDGIAGLFYDIYQEIAIPAGTTSVQLEWSERLQWDTTLGATIARSYEVTLQPAGGGSPLALLFSTALAPGTTGDTGYVTHSVNLLAAVPGIAGQTVRINFHQFIPETFTGPAQFDLDGVSLTLFDNFGVQKVELSQSSPKKTSVAGPYPGGSPLKDRSVDLKMKAAKQASNGVSSQLYSSFAGTHESAKSQPTFRVVPKVLSVPANVLLVAAGADPTILRGSLSAYPDIAMADYFDASSSVPTLFALTTYDVVVVMSDAAFADAVATGDVLADYVDAGGKVIQAVASFATDGGWELQGRFVSGGYEPFVHGPAEFILHSLGSFDAGHPIMAGIAAITDSTNAAVALHAGASLVASWDNGIPLVAPKGDSVVGIDIFAFDEGSWGGDVPLLYRNAIVWLLEGNGGVTYDVYFDTIDPPLTLIHSGLTDPWCEPVPYPLALGTTYYWQVVAHNPGGCQAAGPVWSFRTSDSDCVLNCDLDHNKAVDLMDCSLLASQWLAFNCGTPDFCEGADFNHDGGVDFLDFMELANEWLFTCQTGTQNILLIEDQGGFGTAADVLIADGHNVIVLNDEYAAAYSHLLDTTFLNGFDLVVYGERGDGVGAVLPQAVADSLEAYIQGGGNLLVTGYDTLGSPTDAVLANLVRAVNFGDQVSSSAAWEVTGIDIPILNGPFGDFRNQSFSHLGYDDDYLIPDTSRGAVVLANTPGYSARVIFTDIPSPGGSVGYWNGGSGGTGNAQTDFSSGGIPQAIFQNWAATIGFGFNAPALLKNNWADIQKPVLSFDDLKRIAEKQK
jgi:hypothetical protein